MHSILKATQLAIITIVAIREKRRKGKRNTGKHFVVNFSFFGFHHLYAVSERRWPKRGISTGLLTENEREPWMNQSWEPVLHVLTSRTTGVPTLVCVRECVRAGVCVCMCNSNILLWSTHYRAVKTAMSAAVQAGGAT